MMVSKCCCCFSLKYGFYTFAIVSLLYRVCAATFLYFIIMIQSASPYGSPPIIIDVILVGFGGLVGWYAISATLLGVAIKGIIQERSILLYPYMVVLIIETLITVIAVVYSMIILKATWPIIHILFAPSINTYAVICLNSLSYNFKNYEKRSYASSYHSGSIAAV